MICYCIMLITAKRILRLATVLFIILGAIAYSSYQGRISDAVRTWVNGKEGAVWELIALWSGEENFTDELVMKDVVVVTGGSGAYSVTIERAVTPEERQTGLMNREELCENCGMLFIFDTDTRGGFWMKNCLIALDILFIDGNGVIVDVKENFQPCANDPCPSYRPLHDYRYVLEVNGGWIGQNEITVGDVVSGGPFP